MMKTRANCGPEEKEKAVWPVKEGTFLKASLSKLPECGNSAAEKGNGCSGANRRKRGFYTGIAAALLFFALSGIMLASLALSYRDVTELAQLQSLRVSERVQDSLAFSDAALADAEADSAYFVHGCTPQPLLFCTELRSRLPDYLGLSSRSLSDSIAVAVSFAPSSFSCLQLAPQPSQNPPGFDAVYSVNVSVALNVSGGAVSAIRTIDARHIVSVNSSKAFRVLAGGMKPLEVKVACP